MIATVQGGRVKAYTPDPDQQQSFAAFLPIAVAPPDSPPPAAPSQSSVSIWVKTAIVLSWVGAAALAFACFQQYQAGLTAGLAKNAEALRQSQGQVQTLRSEKANYCGVPGGGS